MKTSAFSPLFLLFLAFGLGAPAARAETGTIEEIVVYGELRETPLAELPGSVSVVDAETIERRQAQHLEQLLAITPNVNWAAGASRGRYLQIRGIGETGQFIEPLNSSVGLVVDGVDFSGVAAVATLYDVEQVEVFRGPQGTLYGANALAGLVNVRTAAPTEALEAGVDAEAGNYGTTSLGARVSGPLAEPLAGRLAVQRYRGDGFAENDHLGRDDTNEFDELTARGKLRWTPSDDVTVDAVAGWIDVDNGYDAFSLDNRRDTLTDSPGRDAQESAYGSLAATFAAASAFDVEAIASIADSDIAYGYDEDWVYEGFDPAGYSSTDLYLRDRRTATGELRLVSKEDGRLFGGTTAWVTGAYLLSQSEWLDRRYTFRDGPFRSRFEIDRSAWFAQTETAFADATTLTLGARLERHRADYRDVDGADFAPEDDLWGARVALDHLVGPDTLLYVSAARGYKAGGFNTDGTLPADLKEFDPETLYNAELGLKGSWREDSITGRVALFHMWRDDMQVSTSLVRTRPDGSSEFIEFTGNAAKGTNYGLEGEVRWHATDLLEAFATLGLLETEYEDFVNAEGRRLDGRDQAHAPGYQAYGGFEWAFAPSMFVRAEVEAKDAFYYSDSHDAKSDAYALVHVSLGWQTRHWQATAWVRNVGDVDYHVRGYYFGNDPRIDYAPRVYTQLGEPRVYGLSLGWAL
jgi:outer membrane receptor protein involved in Fe transport